MHRYIAMIPGPAARSNGKSMRLLEANINAATPAWSWALKLPEMLVAHTGARPGLAGTYPLKNDSGVVLGTLYNGGAAKVTAFDDGETQRILTTGCRHLVDQYWGNYVAFVHDGSQNAYHVLRDPTAQMRCYHTSWNGIDIFFSHIEDCLHFVPLSLSLNWRYVISYLMAGDHVKRESGLNNVEDIPGGERLTIAREKTFRTLLWKPATFCREGLLEDPSAAASALRTTVQTTVNALVSSFSEVALALSGGLDSSILGGCLAQAPNKPRVSCLNYFLTLGFQDEEIQVPTLSKEDFAKFRRVAGNADERRFAKLVSDRWNYHLAEYERRIQDIDLTRVVDAPVSVIPTNYVGFMDIDDLERRFAQERHAEAFLSGYGGDTVLYSTLRPLGAVDYACQHGLGRRFMEELANSCALSKESVWRVFGKAVRFGLLRQRMQATYDSLGRPHLLTDSSAKSVSHDDIQHPWCTLLDDLSPGKQNHIEGLANSGLFYHQQYHRERYVASVNPLLAQPVVEVCLRIPSYTLLAGGVSRGLARTAFADLLPPEIQQRITKGNGSAFYQRLVRTNMTLLREMLLDGVLVREGVLDRKKLEDYLVEGQQFAGATSLQILDYAATDAWARQWASLRQKAAA